MNGLRSLRGRLLLASLSGIVLAAVAAAWLLGAAFERAALGAFDRRLEDDLIMVAGGIARDGDGSIRLRREPADSRYGRVFSGHYWQVGDGTGAFHSRSLWDHTLALPASALDGGVRFADIAGPRGQQLRGAIRTVRLPGANAAVRVWVGSDQAILREEVEEFRWLAGFSFAALAAGLSLAAAAQVRYGLRPLLGLAELLARVRNGLSPRLDLARLPTEVQPLAEHLNELLEHHERMVARARSSAQDLAHALKTPLAVLDLESQDPGPELAATVSAQVARMRGVIERGLASGTPADVGQTTALAPVVDRLLVLMDSAHRERALRLEPAVPAALGFRGAAEDLEEMLGNLLDNACKWARSSVFVSAGDEDGALRIEVRDDGEGLAPDLRAASLERGVRLDERVPGSGLGLAIVQDIAASYGGRLELDAAPEGGLAARLYLPLA